MPGSSVILNQHSRDNKFTDLDFEVVNDPYKIDDENILRVFVSSCNGMIF